MRFVTSKEFIGGVIVGVLIGGWVRSQLQQRVNVNLPGGG